MAVFNLDLRRTGHSSSSSLFLCWIVLFFTVCLIMLIMNGIYTGYSQIQTQTAKMLMFEDSMVTTIDNSLKETMISQEGVFRKQVSELHRLYGIQRNLMENFGWKKMDAYDLWNAHQLDQSYNHHHHHNYVVESPKESLKLDEVNLSLCLRGVTGEATKEKGDDGGSSKPWWYNISCNHHHHPVIIDLDEPEVSNLCGTTMKKKDGDDDDDSCVIIMQDGTGSTSSIKGLLDLNKQPAEDDDDNSSDIFFKNSIVDSNSNLSSSCSNRPIDLNSISINDRDSADGSNNDSSTCRRVVDLGILEAVESLMSIQLELELEQPQQSLDSYELIVLNLEDEISDNCACVSSKGCENIISDEKEQGVNLVRRGKRRVKDFQKDVLPSLACLSRQEVREDVNIMEAVIKSREYKRIMKAKTKTTIRGGDRYFDSL